MNSIQRTCLTALLIVIALPLAAQAATKLNPPLVDGGNITQHLISPDGSRIIYRADQETDDVFELFSIPLGGGPSTKLSGPLIDGGDVDGLFRVVPDSSRVIYFADQDTDNVLELYSAPIDGSAQAVKLNGPLVSGGNVNPFDFAIADDSSRIAYLADQDVDERDEVYSRLLDGSGMAMKLNGPLVSGGDVLNFSISPDSNTVAYRASQENEFRDELYSRPIDGSGSAAKISGPLVQGGDVGFVFRFTPDSSRIIYRADQETDSSFELYSRASDGSGMPVKINGPLVTDGSVSGAFRITPDSARVVYGAEQETIDRLEIFIRPLDGSGTPRKLSGSLVTGGDAFVEDLSPDGTQLVYLADQNVDDVTEAFTVAIDGGESPQELNGPLVSGGEVLGGRITPDGANYIYFADEETAGVIEIFSSPIDGSGMSTKLNGSLTGAGQVWAFAPSADSEFVTFLEGNFFASTGLFAVETTGGTVRMLNGPFVAGGSIDGLMDIAPDSRTVIYRADQDTDGVIELYLATIAQFEADFDLDGDVDGDDFLLWQGGFGIPAGAQKSDGDYDNDGDVDGDDFLGWQAEFGSGSGAASMAVPEPSSFALALFMAAVAMVVRRSGFGQPMR